MAGGEVVGRAECGCCGMWEECTLEYIGWVRARFGGVCGLCEEAIKDERARLGVGVEVAPRVHATFRESANVGPPIPEAQSIVQLIKILHFFFTQIGFLLRDSDFDGACEKAQGRVDYYLIDFPEAKAYNNLMVKRLEL
ncbi:hypothetical protein OIU85_013997 [Salix viminalis]|uniref:Uncharacterized protein n=1 Tax=Salix viminalis TaxID=40686 RepID=A0A9Q0NMW2_SALVM|nr:hypothetical protein OIU85_013997 [Salix viminalis]